MCIKLGNVVSDLVVRYVLSLFLYQYVAGRVYLPELIQ